MMKGVPHFNWASATVRGYFVDYLNQYHLGKDLTVAEHDDLKKFSAYFIKNYFCETAKFNPKLWNYFHSHLFGYTDTTNNLAEGLNRQFKAECLKGPITLHKACQYVYDFKRDKLSSFLNFQVLGAIPRKPRRHVRERHAKLRSLCRQYNYIDNLYMETNQSESTKKDLVLETIYKLGNVKHLDNIELNHSINSILF